MQSVTAPSRGAVAYTYSPAGRVEQIDHPDGTRTEETYDDAGRLATIAHFRAGIREAFYAYDYDLNGNRSSQTEDLGFGEVETTYDYDAADRLIETERDGRITTYVLDAVGNREEEIVTEGAVTTVKTFDYNDRDQLERTWIDGALEAEYAYDANGNRIEATTGGVTREFNFGARDRLLSLNVQGSPPEVEWTYDDAGFRIAETTPTDARRFRWDGESMAFETNVLGNLLMRYDHGPDRLLAETEAGNTRTWLTDALKTPVKRLTDTGSTYSVTRYDEYGEVEEESSPDIPRFGFTGHQRGPAEAPDLYYAQQRWYNAATGRFISEDPVWGEPKRPPSLHRYLYAYANPTVFVDPDGRMGVPNFWSDLEEYESQGICSGCSTRVESRSGPNVPTTEGSPAQSRNAPRAKVLSESQGSIGALEEDLAQATAAVNEYGRFPHSVPPEFHSLVGSADDHYNSVVRERTLAKRRLDGAKAKQRFIEGTETAINAAGTGLAIGGAGLACASGVGCAAGAVLAAVALDQYLADEGVTDRSVTVDATTFLIIQSGITENQQAAEQLVETTILGVNSVRSTKALMHLSSTRDSSMLETVTGAVDGALQAEEVRQELSDSEDRD